MSFLRDFGGSLLTNVGADMQKREDDTRLTALQESIEKRRYAREMNRKSRDEKQLPQAYGQPTFMGPGGYMQPTKQFIGPTYDENTGDPLTEAEWKDGPYMPAPDPNALKPYEAARIDLARDNALMTDARYRDRTDQMGKSGGGSGAGKSPVSSSRVIDGIPHLFENGEWTPMPVKGGAGEPTSKASTAYKAALDKERSRASTYVNKQLEALNKLPEEKALAKIYESTNIHAPSLSAYRENLIQAAMAPWMQENPAPGNDAPAGGRPRPQTAADVAKLPSGTEYVAPDGSIRITR